MSNPDRQAMDRALAIQEGMRPTPPSDPNLDMVLQSLFVDDSEIKRILKGEINESVDKLDVVTKKLGEFVLSCVQLGSIDKAQAETIIALLRQTNPLVDQIQFQLSRYFRMTPYLLLLSPLVRLGNNDKKSVDEYCRKVELMIGRDKLMSTWDEGIFDLTNFFDALTILIKMAFRESENGFKVRILTEEKRQVAVAFQDGLPSGRRKRFKIF